MQISLDRASPQPVYGQIRDAIRHRIESGELPPGTKLPSSRSLASTLEVHRSTVISAYKDLESSGLLQSGVGQGTFVCRTDLLTHPGLSPMAGGAAEMAAAHHLTGVQDSAAAGTSHDPFNWATHLARPGRSLDGDLVRELVPAHQEPGTISFQRAIPDPEFYPAQALRDIITEISREGDRSVYDYGPPAGHEPLRAWIRGRMAARGTDPCDNDVLIVNGSQQALHLVAALLLDRRSSLVVESPTFAGALDVFRMQQAGIVSVPMDGQGLDTTALAESVRAVRPRLLYTIPTFHNPTGLTLAVERRRRLVDMAAREQFPILEDDWLGELRAPGDPPPLKALDRGGHVITLSTFSKVVVPGLRVGWLVAPRPAFEALCALKSRFDICTNTLGQAVLYELARRGELDHQIERIRRVYAVRLGAVLEAIDRHFPPEVEASRPTGGITLWVELPATLDPLQVFDQARRAGVLLSPGPLFTPEGSGTRGFRLCFSTTPEAQIERGISILGHVLRDLLRRFRRAPSHTEGPPLV